jgi:hypothetical protein
MIQQHSSSLYHPQANAMVEEFNKILERGLTKVFTINHDDWDEWIPVVLWAYITTRKKLTKHSPSGLW